jgi:hypothetical protein
MGKCRSTQRQSAINIDKRITSPYLLPEPEVYNGHNLRAYLTLCAQIPRARHLRLRLVP